MNNQIQTAQLDIGKFLQKNEKKIMAALPEHMTVTRMLSIVMTEVRKTPKLTKCSLPSLFSAVLQCSQLGLEPGNALGHAYLIPYADTCQFIVGYRGMIDLARRSGQIISITAQTVYENDHFEFEFGLNEKLKHVPADGERGRLVRVYALAKLKDGGYQFDVMSKEQVDKIRSRSKSKDNGPWVTDYEEMAKKTVIRKLFKYLPVSIELQKAAALDESAERGEQDNRYVIDGEFEEANEHEKTTKSKSDEIAEKLAKAS